MNPIRLAFCLIYLLVAGATYAQDAASEAGQTAAAAAAASANGEGEGANDRRWRDTSAYPFRALADNALRLELVAQAMQLREFCANQRVPDSFVRERLQRFAALSGRPEDCRSLLDY